MELWWWWSRSLGRWCTLTRLKLYAEVRNKHCVFVCMFLCCYRFFSFIQNGRFSWATSTFSVLHLAGYWPSYNIPFHVEIYNLSGYGVMWKRYGEDFSYDLCPRAKILRRDQSKVSDLSSLKRIMRYNSRWNSNSCTPHIHPFLNSKGFRNVTESINISLSCRYF